MPQPNPYDDDFPSERDPQFILAYRKSCEISFVDEAFATSWNLLNEEEKMQYVTTRDRLCVEFSELVNVIPAPEKRNELYIKCGMHFLEFVIGSEVLKQFREDMKNRGSKNWKVEGF